MPRRVSLPVPVSMFSTSLTPLTRRPAASPSPGAPSFATPSSDTETELVRERYRAVSDPAPPTITSAPSPTTPAADPFVALNVSPLGPPNIVSRPSSPCRKSNPSSPCSSSFATPPNSWSSPGPPNRTSRAAPAVDEVVPAETADHVRTVGADQRVRPRCPGDRARRRARTQRSDGQSRQHERRRGDPRQRHEHRSMSHDPLRLSGNAAGPCRIMAPHARRRQWRPARAATRRAAAARADWLPSDRGRHPAARSRDRRPARRRPDPRPDLRRHPSRSPGVDDRDGEDVRAELGRRSRRSRRRVQRRPPVRGAHAPSPRTRRGPARRSCGCTVAASSPAPTSATTDGSTSGASATASSACPSTTGSHPSGRTPARSRTATPRCSGRSSTPTSSASTRLGSASAARAPVATRPPASPCSHATEASCPLAFCALVYPMLDDRMITPSSGWDVPIWPPSSNDFGWNAYLADGAAPTTCRSTRRRHGPTDLAGLPPTFICVGALDGFLDEDIDYAQRLARAGVAVELHVYPGAPHGFDLMMVGTRDRRPRSPPPRRVARRPSRLNARSLARAARDGSTSARSSL